MGSAARLQVPRRELQSIPFTCPQCPVGRVQLQGSDEVSAMRTEVEPSLHWCPMFSFRAAALVIRLRAMWHPPEWDDCCCLAAKSCSTLCDPMDLQPARLLCPWNPPDKNTGVDCHFLLQRIFPTQDSSPLLLCPLHWQADWILYHWPAWVPQSLA